MTHADALHSLKQRRSAATHQLHGAAVAPCAKAAQDIDRIGAQQRHVEKNDAGMAAVDCRQRFLGHVETRDLHSEVRQRRFNEPPNLGVVIDNDRQTRVDSNAGSTYLTHAGSLTHCAENRR
jgi:hypothetical protein